MPGEAVLLRLGQREIGVGLAADIERAAAFEAVEGWWDKAGSLVDRATGDTSEGRRDFACVILKATGEEERLSRRVVADIVDFVSRHQTSWSRSKLSGP